MYDPASGSWTATDSLDSPRDLHTATLLFNGRVLVSGGRLNSGEDVLGSAELYNYTQLLYPQLALGGGFEVVFLATNQSRKDWRGRGELNNRDNCSRCPGLFLVLPWMLEGEDRTGETGFDISLGPHQTRKFTLSRDGPVVSGWLAVKGHSQIADLATSFFYNFFAGAELGDSTGVGVAPAVTAVTFPVERSAQINTGIALRQTQARVNLRLYDEAGVSLALAVAAAREHALLTSSLRFPRTLWARFGPSLRGHFTWACCARR